jgi:hypothetical protein
MKLLTKVMTVLALVFFSVNSNAQKIKTVEGDLFGFKE